MNKFFPADFSFTSCLSLTASERTPLVLDFIAARGVPRLFDPEDLGKLKKPDDFLVVTFLCLIYSWLQRDVPDFATITAASASTPAAAAAAAAAAVSANPSPSPSTLNSPLGIKRPPKPAAELATTPAPAPASASTSSPISPVTAVSPQANQAAPFPPASRPVSQRVHKFVPKGEYQHPIQNLLASELDSLQTKLTKEERAKVLNAIGTWWQQELDVMIPFITINVWSTHLDLFSIFQFSIYDFEPKHMEVETVLFNAMGEVDQLNEGFVQGLQQKLQDTEAHYKEQLSEMEKKLKRMSFSQLQSRPGGGSGDADKRAAALERELADARKEIETLKAKGSAAPQRPMLNPKPVLPPSLSTFARSQGGYSSPSVADDDGEITSSDEEEEITTPVPPSFVAPPPLSALPPLPTLEPAVPVTSRVKELGRSANVQNRRTWITQRFASLDQEDNGEVDDKRMIYDFDEPEEPPSPGELAKKTTIVNKSILFPIFASPFVNFKTIFVVCQKPTPFKLPTSSFHSELESKLSRQVSTLRQQKPVQRSRQSTLPDVLINPGGFRLEDGTDLPWWLQKGAPTPLSPKDQQVESVDAIMQHPLVENPEFDASWYLKFFYLKEHQIFIGDHDKHGPFVVCIVKEDVAEVPKQNFCLSSPYSHYRAMIWLKTCIERVTIPDTGSSPSIVQVMSAVCPSLTKGIKELKVSTNSSLPKQLLKIEEIQTVRSFKFGILYVKEGQTLEEDMFGNSEFPPSLPPSGLQASAVTKTLVGFLSFFFFLISQRMAAQSSTSSFPFSVTRSS